MGKKNNAEARFCPFKKAASKGYNGMTGIEETHERFEECAGERCMAWIPGNRCKRLEAQDGAK